MAKPRKSNKTAHVLSLLTNPENPENSENPENGQENDIGESSEKDIAAQEETAKPAPQKLQNSLLDKKAQANLSELVKGELEKEYAVSDKDKDVQEEANAESANVARHKKIDENVNESTSITAGDALLATPDMAVYGELKDGEGFDMSENGNGKGNVESITGHDEVYISMNLMEDIVKSKALGFIQQMGGCTCLRCVNDVIAMSLNSLPPKYTVTQKGVLMAKVASYENQYATDIVSALTKACMDVKNSPRH